MLLSQLLDRAGIASAAGDDSVEISGIAYDSRQIRPGFLFVALPGIHSDGHDFVPEALSRGATAVIVQRPITDIRQRLVEVPDARLALSKLSALFYGEPSRKMYVAGTTGTDGKTTTTTMLWAAWRAAGIEAASFTTVDVRTPEIITHNVSRMTTQEAPELQAQLAEFARNGCTHLALETSSHALELHRVEDVNYDMAIYTRITSEHLDIHGSWEGYFRAKRHLLELAHDGIAVLNADDELAYPRLAAVPVRQRLTYSSTNSDADVTAHGIRMTEAGAHFEAHTPWGNIEMSLKIPGSFNVGNALAALTAAVASGAPLDDAARGISDLSHVTGRMERVLCGQEFNVVVDYAHTADALRKVLAELRPATTGHLWVVFCSAGERDLDKRPKMGRVAAELADYVVVTDEDPRGEDRQKILDEIASGAVEAGAVENEKLYLIADRREAIAFALNRAQRFDTVLLAGKGHEQSIIMADGSVPWDERHVAEEILKERTGVR